MPYNLDDFPFERFPTFNGPISADFFTSCSTPEDAYVFPGKLNHTSNNQPVLDFKSNLKDHINSLRHNASKLGKKHPIDWEAKYSQPGFPKNVVEPSDPQGDSIRPQNSDELLRKLIEHHKNIAYNDSEEITEDEPFILKEPSTSSQFDYRTVLPDLNAMSMMGDPRASHGCVLQAVYQKFLPRIEAYREMLNCGGITIEQECICDAEGVAIAKPSSLLLSVFADLSSRCGKYIPPITPGEAANFILDFREAALQNHADAFVTYIEKNYPLTTWPIRKAIHTQIGFFFILISKQEPLRVQDILNDEEQRKQFTSTNTTDINSKASEGNSVFLRYYSDQKEYISQKLNTPLSEIEGFLVSSQNAKAYSDMAKPIPDYTRMV